MNDKYKNKYRVDTTRVRWHNYAGGTYFITICTNNMIHYFGEIYDKKMHFSDIGKYTEECIDKIKEHFPIAEVLEYVVMPNHIHMILHIEGSNVTNNRNSFGPQSQNLASIIRGFKIGVTQYANANNIKFAWQSRYHDHIIRNMKEMNRIAEYIRNNVIKW